VRKTATRVISREPPPTFFSLLCVFFMSQLLTGRRRDGRCSGPPRGFAPRYGSCLENFPLTPPAPAVTSAVPGLPWLQFLMFHAFYFPVRRSLLRNGFAARTQCVSGCWFPRKLGFLPYVPENLLFSSAFHVRQSRLLRWLKKDMQRLLEVLPPLLSSPSFPNRIPNRSRLEIRRTPTTIPPCRPLLPSPHRTTLIFLRKKKSLLRKGLVTSSLARPFPSTRFYVPRDRPEIRLPHETRVPPLLAIQAELSPQKESLKWNSPLCTTG